MSSDTFLARSEAGEAPPCFRPQGDLRPRVLVAESIGFSPQAVRLLWKQADVVLANLGREELLAAVRGVDMLWVRLRNQIDEEVLRAAPRLKVLVTATTGLNHIDLDAAQRHGVRVLSLRGETAFLDQIHGTAEHTLGLMLALVRRLPAAHAHVLSGGWNRDAFKGSELCNKTIGIVGYGRLGRMVASYLAPFGPRIVATDPRFAEGQRVGQVAFVSLTQLLEQSHIVSLHVSLTEESRGLLGKREFERLPRGALLINTARGELVDEPALLSALRSGQLAGAALDVLCDERSAGMEQHPLVAYAREHNHLILTPHIGGCTEESMQATEEFLAGKLLAELSEHAGWMPHV